MNGRNSQYYKLWNSVISSAASKEETRWHKWTIVIQTSHIYNSKCMEVLFSGRYPVKFNTIQISTLLETIFSQINLVIQWGRASLQNNKPPCNPLALLTYPPFGYTSCLNHLAFQIYFHLLNVSHLFFLTKLSTCPFICI